MEALSPRERGGYAHPMMRGRFGSAGLGPPNFFLGSFFFNPGK
jgi:hypothetical protein